MDTPRMQRALLVALATAAAYGVASEITMLMLPFKVDTALVWLASAVGIAAMLVYGPAAAAGVAIGSLGCALISGRSLLEAPLVAALYTGQIALAWWLIARVFKVDLRLSRVRDMFMLLLLGALISPLASGVRALLAAVFQQRTIDMEYLALVKVAAIGEGVGILMVVPAALAWLVRGGERLDAYRKLEAVALYATTVVLSLAVFGGLARAMIAVESLPYALFPIMFWAAIRLGVRETATVFLLAGLIAVTCTAKGLGPFSGSQISGGIALLHLASLYLFLSVLGVTGLLFAAGRRQLMLSQAALRASEENYRLLVENQTDVVLRFDPNGTVTFASPSYLQFFGMDEKAVLGHPLSIQVHDEDKAVASAAWAEVCKPPFTGRVEMRVMTPSGWRWVAWSARATTCAAGSAESVIAVGRDVTDRHRAEEQARQHLQQLAHVGRVSSMGEMASAIAHEINQPLTAIANYASACLRMLRAGRMGEGEALEAMQRVAAEAERAGEIVRQMRGCVRGEDSQLGAVDSAFLIEEVVRLAGPEARQSGISLEVQCPGDLPPVLADSIQVQQVLLNLVRNAVDAINGAECSERRVRITAQAREAGMVELSVTDSGPGLCESDLERVFDAFYTTKADGIGIGLALSRSIADAHGGRLWATAGTRGATFHLELPSAEEHELADA